MGKTLEFALVTAMITIVHLSFAFWAATTIGNEITDLFQSVIITNLTQTKEKTKWITTIMKNS